MSFKDMVDADILSVFLNANEFATLHTIVYDGVTYDGEDGNGILVLLTRIKEKDRVHIVTDHAQGLFRVTEVLHIDSMCLGGIIPEQGSKLKISEGGFFREFYVASSSVSMGMTRVELEAFDE